MAPLLHRALCGRHRAAHRPVPQLQPSHTACSQGCEAGAGIRDDFASSSSRPLFLVSGQWVCSQSAPLWQLRCQGEACPDTGSHCKKQRQTLQARPGHAAPAARQCSSLATAVAYSGAGVVSGWETECGIEASSRMADRSNASEPPVHGVQERHTTEWLGAGATHDGMARSRIDKQSDS